MNDEKVTQGMARVMAFIPPNGRIEEGYVDVGPEHAARAVGMALSMEPQAGDVILYGRLETDQDEDEDIEICPNKPGQPTEALKRLIDRVAQRRG